MWQLAAAGAAAGIAGGIAGAVAAGPARDDAKKAIQAALKRIYGIELPNITDEQIALVAPELAGKLTVEEEQTIAQGPSAFEAITADPRLKEAQMNALAKLQQVGAEGLTSEDVAALNTARRTMGREATARDSSILQNMAQRGMGGSGQELAARMGGAQAAAERGSMEADSQAAMAQSRALQAMMQSGTLSGQIRGQDFEEQSAVARAKDAISQFNTSNQRDVQGNNINRNMNVSQYNLGAQQSINNTKATNANTQEMHNKALNGTQYDRKVALASLKSNADFTSAKHSQEEADEKAKFWAGIGGSVASGLGAASGAAGALKK